MKPRPAGPDVGAAVAGGLGIARSDPVIFLAPRVFLLDDLGVVSFLAQLGDPDPFDRWRRDVDVERNLRTAALSGAGPGRFLDEPRPPCRNRKRPAPSGMRETAAEGMSRKVPWIAAATVPE